MSHYRPYPACKGSEGEWLGMVPGHWEFKLLTSVGRFQSGKAHEPYIDDEGDFICVNSRFVSTEGEAKKYCTQNLSPAFVDDILMVMSDLPNGRALAKAFYVEKNGIYAVNQRVCIISSQDCRARFLFYLLDRNPYFLSWDDGINQTHLPNSAFTKFKFYLPPISEQKVIADYLDRETARIDALVEKKTRFIELLREKRQALITHAVTKGLDPNVKMKDSGVEWLGEVPEHWRVMSIKHIVSTPITDGPHETPEFLDEGVPFVSAEAVSSGRVDFDKIRGFISRNDHKRYSQKYCPQRGDIFMIKSGATTGVTAIVETDEEFNIWSPLAVIRCGESSDPYFVLNFMRSRSFQEAVALSWSYGTQQNIGMGVISNLAVTVPPLEEQRSIAQVIQAKCGRLDALVEKTERSIELLKERRSALITAAVTGQIDLREAV
ncbi:restriction endonuclease subunit S [Pseudomonas sp. 2FE]|uniref:restriction endonuclease subunit S n=1 Tax=Pseudomonas sp. 2FE TaxID=2502190 RepID=UPI0010F5F576|nr:restriction endonuclease subunit S [Pseudomonas sp. 2FE]